MFEPDDGHVAIFATPSTRRWRGITSLFCGFLAGRPFRFAQRDLRYATVEFIAALHPIPDRTPPVADRRHRGRQPAGRRRVDLTARRSRHGNGQALDGLNVTCEQAAGLIE